MSGTAGMRDDATPDRIRVVVADDQAIIRDGLVTVLGLLPDMEVVGSASDGAEAVALAVAERPDVVLMDLRMPVLDGVGATERIVREAPGSAVLVLTTFADDESILAALRAGAPAISPRTPAAPSWPPPSGPWLAARRLSPRRSAPASSARSPPRRPPGRPTPPARS